ncbi:Regulator of microtubule dynamics protein [Schistosoma japonicum]|uniref:Regulator of microtubule dynamics protein 1 n=2 Tax=Schistosoma japonicum TaxID=6182 RepID=A0A4Z2DAV3_SCHJA|nr:Regulator of microtubule dynamics protein 1 [Schistosoma japonicum]TNN13641.1 Regulator of microtubule dynamics protein [Schistosoma japonicum]
MDAVITEWKRLDNDKEYKKAYDVVCNALNNNTKSPEIYWRKAHSCRNLAISLGKNDKQIYKKYIEEGLLACSEGLQIDSENPKCNSWYGIFLNLSSELEGINKRIENSFKMKDHWMKAIKADPDDFVTLHALGRWCFEVTDLPWIKRKFAATFFGEPPTSTYEEALNYLLGCEKKAPGVIVKNSLYLAKTYHKLMNHDLAKHYCHKVLEFTENDLDTEEAKKEASELLKKL